MRMERALLELFGAHEREDEVDHNDHNHHRAKKIFKHGFFLALGARTERDVGPQQDKGPDADDQHEEIIAWHGAAFSVLSASSR